MDQMLEADAMSGDMDETVRVLLEKTGQIHVHDSGSERVYFTALYKLRA
jgi:hypothetical protein